MLKTLQIKNFALIDNIELSFDKRLNIITGETGAGKSIIVDALMIALGDRASVDFVRHGEKKSVIEAVFDNENKKQIDKILSEFDFDIDWSDLILRREISDKGSSRCFINDTPVQLNQLKRIGDLLVDFHGQHDHQMLLNKESHILFLDIVAETKNEIEAYFEQFENLKKIINDYNKLIDRKKKINEKYDEYSYELNEISKINPQNGEEEKLEIELIIKENSELLFNTTNELYTLLYDEENSIIDKLSKSKKILEQINPIEPKFNEFLNECSAAIISINEIAKFTKDYNSNIIFDSDSIDKIRERINQLRLLRKKYGTIESALERKSYLANELSLIENFDEQIKNTEQSIIVLKKKAGNLAKNISKKRISSAKIFETEIEKTLKTLGIEYSLFKVIFRNEKIENPNISDLSVVIDDAEYKALADGIDTIEFYMTTNKGEVPKAMADIASGGEISRIMLAIKYVAAKSDLLPILIFDEIDSGISGRIAQKVGLAMKDLSSKNQIIAITHLPQIAALGSKNISITKFEKNGRTLVNSKILSNDEKIKEIAKLISGEIVTDASLESARELIKHSK